MVLSVDTGIMGWSSMDKVLTLFWQLLHFFQAFSLPCSRSPSSVHVQVAFQCFPSRTDHFYTLLLGNKVLSSTAVCEDMCECVMKFRAPQVSEKLELSLQSYNDTELLDAKTFHLAPLVTSSLRMNVSSTTAMFNWPTLDDGDVLDVCLDEQCWVATHFQPFHQVTGLQPGRRYNISVAKKTFVPHLQINVKQSQNLAIKTGQCPVGWLAVGWSCYKVNPGFMSWTGAKQACERSTPGSHLANIKTDAEFLSIISFLESYSHLLLLWTALNDRETEGDFRWSDGSTYNLKIEMTSSLAANQTGCIAMQKNATGAGYFFTAFLCYLQLPYICQEELLQSSSEWLYLESVCETEAAFIWLNESHLDLSAGFILALQSKDESKDQTVSHMVLRNTQDIVRVQGLSPGHVYHFSLVLTHPSGASQTLGPIFIANTKPNPPRNLTVTAVTSSQIALCWSAPDSTHNARFEHFILHWVELVSGRGHAIRLDKMNRSAVIGGLKAYHAHRITVVSVTAQGVESSDSLSVTVITEVSPPRGVSVEAVGLENITVCWRPSLDEDVDKYYIQLHPQTNQAQTREFWVNGSTCISLTQLKSGGTYEVGVASVKGRNMSVVTTIQQTLKPDSIQIAVPYKVGTHSVELFVQMPRNSFYDGITITYQNNRSWTPLSKDSTKLLVDNLSPGTQYDFNVFVTSRNTSSEGFALPPVRTCLAPPTHVRAGVVTDSSIELLWDGAEGSGHHYEALCMNCADTVMVQKVVDTRAIFIDVIAGKLCNFSVRTEKEFFRDSLAVIITIRAAPSPVTLLPVQRTSASLSVRWRAGWGVCDSFILSVRNSTFILQTSQRASDDRAYHFDNLLPGSVYTVEVSSVSGDRRSLPAAVNTNTLPEPPDDLTFIEQEVSSMYVMWTHPPGKVDGYRLQYGFAGDLPLQHQVDLHDNSVRIHDLTPGSDYRFEIQSFLGSDFSQTTSQNISTRPAGVCSLSVSHVNGTSVTVSWEQATGHLDFYRVAVSNSSHIWTLDVSPQSQQVTVSSLWNSCSYNITVQRFRNNISGNATTVTIHTVPASPKGLRVISVSPRAFSLHWLASPGCDKKYMVQLCPDHGNINITTTADSSVQAQVSSVTPGTSYTVTVNAVASSGFSSPVSRILVTTIESLPAAPSKPEGERVGSTGILLSWRMPMPLDPSIHSFVIRYKEMCPYPDPTFTEVTKSLDIPETLLNTLTPGATYNIKVAAVNKAGIGPFSQSLYYKTAEAPPGLVSNLTAFAEDHTSVLVTWFLPVRINGLITKFAVKVKHARTSQIIRTLELNAEDIMNGALPHCNDAADILSRGTPSPSESSQLTSAVLPTVTLSAVPPASIWSVPISVKIDELRPYTPYVFEVSAFTSDGEGQIASTMVRMPEAAPEDPPQNVVFRNITSKSLSLTWDPPKITTGRFSYVIQLHSSEGVISENSTIEQAFMYTGLTPYTRYYVHVMAKSSGATGPAAVINITTLAEAPNAVSHLTAEAVDSTSVRLSWRPPSQPNGLITHYRILVLYRSTLVQDITLRGQNAPLRRNARSLDITTSSAFLLTSHRTFPALGRDFTNTDTELTSDLPLTPSTPHTPPPWLTVTHDRTDVSVEAETETVTEEPLTELSAVTRGTDQPPLVNLSPSQPRRSTRAVATDSTQKQTNPSTRAATTIGIEVLPATEETVDLSSDHIMYVVRRLSPFTEYKFSVTAKNIIGEGPSTEVTVKTTEQVPSSVQNVSYQNLTSTSIRVTWEPPLNPNGKITHYTVYAQNLLTNQQLRQMADTITAVLTDLDKYSSYKVRVAASTAVGESPLTDEDYIFIMTLEDEPDSPPRDLVVVKTTSSTATLTWSPPEKPNGIIRLYEVSYTNGTYSNTVNSTSPSATLRYLKPYTHFNVTVRAFTLHGHGNQISDTLQMLSGEDVPGSPPYDLTHENIGSSEVNVSWSPPLLANGIILFYNVEYWNATHSLNQTTHVPYVILSDLRKYAHYRISVQAATQVGLGNHTSEILNITTLEDVPSGPVHNLTATIYSSTAVVISWDPPLEPNGRVFYQLSLQEAGMTHPSINRTVNITIAKTTTDNIYLFTKLRKYFPYIIKVTPATSAGSAVNHTVMLHLRTDEDFPSSPPLPGASRNLSSTSIHVSWFPPVEANGEIIDYAVALQGPGTVNRTYTTETHLMLSELTPFTPYNLSIAAVTRIGVGPSVIIPLHTDEAVPMSPPRDLIIFNHTVNSVWLQWEPSPEPNGIVQHYGFRILELNTYSFSYQNSSDASTQAELSGFRPHNSYEISVCAFTRAGNGDQYSLPVVFTTNESVSDAIGNLTCSGLDWNSVYMEWELPIHPNGEILYYLIRSGDLEEEAHPLMLTHTVVHTFIGLSPNAFYVISVAAVNSAGIGEEANCTAHTPPESVPGPPQSLTIMDVTSDSVSLSWQRPVHVPGLLQGYNLEIQKLARNCEPEQHMKSCVESELVEWVEGVTSEVTLSPLLKYREYRIRLVAFTRAGAGEPSDWIHTQTLAGNPDAPPSAISAFPSPTGLKIMWDEPSVISGPTSYIIDITALDGSGYNISLVRHSEEIRTVVIGNLTAFTLYSITITAFTGQLSNARTDGKASEPILVRTLEDEPKDPPKNVTLTVIPEEVTRVYVTFSPPDEPNGNISAYHVTIYRNGQLDFYINSLSVISNLNKTMTAIIDGLKGGFNYSIRIAAVNGAGLGPSSEVQVTTGVKAPPKPLRRPRAALNNAGVIISTSKTITIEMPECFFTDDHGPIRKVQVIVSEPAVMDYGNLSNWKSVFLYPTAPYLTDEGFLNPKCSEKAERMSTNTNTYVIGADEGCLSEDAKTLCNGPLKPKTYYVFKFRATNIRGQYTDSEYSDRVRTADDRLLTRDEQIILGVLLSFFLALFFILIIYGSVRIHRRQKEGGTYSPREAEIIETKFKLDQLIAVADLELKEEKINRLLSYRKSLKPISKKSFLQHVEDLCANDNAKFQEEFAELPKLLQDLATSDADLPWNRSKNRFTNIKPYNNNRVKLLSEPGMPGSDYINASFVSGYLCPNEFIATQGPLPSTVADFWRMIWETGTKTIVMLTQCFEKGRIRCHQYWPEDNKPVTVFADIIITKLTEDVHPDWTVRALRVERHGSYMIVHHFNYTSWPEHGVPESSSTLIQFVKAVRSHRGHDNTTIVVHCSAGVGRTGVFVALDHLIQHVRDHDFVDIYGLVAELRSERMCMVQNLAQYMFLHQSTLDLLSAKGNSQSIWFVNYSTLEKMDSLDAMEGDVELEWEETTM
ncbi:phosphatidylinositol phosphatase PTPRQ isoform X2 [Onychostoma macrolepis]|uniref:phosphatidylinositol phosphatase PTPRQ isoform X2 n=1 Tax=Onychostoma macrolepis TaxID=369639 RepID=UPI00272AF6AE|nr:phosphatidylinositol phosphatase PTPRQ isoform X2 [Onychostoma macrolepis]